jgi:hypothetical protein
MFDFVRNQRFTIIKYWIYQRDQNHVYNEIHFINEN